MHIHVGPHWEYEPSGWSFGYCPSCQEHGVLRLETEFLAYYLNGLIRVSREERGRIARCDFCERRVEEAVDWKGVPLEKYSPREGLPRLMELLRRQRPAGGNPPASDTRLHSLLSAVEKRTKAHGQEISLVGAVIGAVVVVLLCIPLSDWLIESQIATPPVGRSVFIPGVFVGLILGGFVEFLIRRDKFASRKFLSAHSDYGIDLYRLEELAEGYSKRVRKSVRQVCRRCR